MPSPSPTTPTLLATLISVLWAPAIGHAAPWAFAQYPAGSASREPAPNVIVSVDDSGSMGSNGIAALAAALKNTFSDTNLPDDKIRLAWQSMNGCNGIPNTNTKTCGGPNTMKSLSGDHRKNFLAWVNALESSGWTPSHTMVFNAGNYLMTTGANSPWNAKPGTTDTKPLACRRAYHLFMTDGEWNGSGQTPDGDRCDKSGGFLGSLLGSCAGSPYTRLLRSDSGNLDGTDVLLPDGTTSYSTSSNQTRVYRDSWGFKSATTGFTTDPYGVNTLSDLAFYYWSTDLQPGIANEIKPLVRKSGTETFGTAPSTTALAEYWNPKNNPATWQHLTTYTLGYNAAADLSSTDKSYPDFDPLAGTFGGEFWKLVTGEKTWPSPFCGSNGDKPCESSFGSTFDYTDRSKARMYELWHMAINSRGKFVPATSATSLTDAFKEILGNIVADNSRPITGFASASNSITRNGTTQFSSGYTAQGWTGYVRSDLISQTTGAATANPAWGLNPNLSAPNNHLTTADKLDALTDADTANRLILTVNGSSDTAKGVAFEWTEVQSLLGSLLSSTLSASTDQQNLLNYVRGIRSNEGKTVGKIAFRTRTSRAGDIVNSALWFVGPPASNYSLDNYRTFAATHKERLPMVYAGGNDGMLHGFSAKDGSEKIAYLPRGVIKNLPLLAQDGYSHQYFVDGSPFSGDVKLADDWHTLLVGTLGAGGKGYFVLDVTAPGTTAAVGSGVAANFTKSNAAKLVVLDKTWHTSETVTGSDADIGHVFAPPTVDNSNSQKSTQLTLLNNGRWAVVMGNGYNSTNERPVLLIQYLDGAKELKTLVASSAAGQGNGLSAPQLVDINRDGKPDVVYAGDLKGNLWKFDIAHSDASQWGVAFAGQPLFQALDTSKSPAVPQSITTAPIVQMNDRGVNGLMVSFGTGKNFTEADRTDTSRQTLYSVLDNSVYKKGSTDSTLAVDTSKGNPTRISGLGELVEQTVNTTAVAGTGTSTGRNFWTVSQNSVSYTSPTDAKKGWYLHFPVGGERLLETLSFYDNSNILEVVSEVPASGGSLLEESCAPSLEQARKYRTLLNIMDGKRPSVQIMNTNGDTVFSAVDDKNTSRMEASFKEVRVLSGAIQIRTGSDGKKDLLATLPDRPVRPSWRQFQ
ncbi:MAG: PilC/PilY family type IV pilus protein [Burkholderiaceae bacterium]|nr:PilC/PilY family type IV pilus protein [Burkholderiaceae bacterium]